MSPQSRNNLLIAEVGKRWNILEERLQLIQPNNASVSAEKAIYHSRKIIDSSHGSFHQSSIHAQFSSSNVKPSLGQSSSSVPVFRCIFLVYAISSCSMPTVGVTEHQVALTWSSSSSSLAALEYLIRRQHVHSGCHRAPRRADLEFVDLGLMVVSSLIRVSVCLSSRLYSSSYYFVSIILEEKKCLNCNYYYYCLV